MANYLYELSSCELYSSLRKPKKLDKWMDDKLCFSSVILYKL